MFAPAVRMLAILLRTSHSATLMLKVSLSTVAVSGLVAIGAAEGGALDSGLALMGPDGPFELFVWCTKGAAVSCGNWPKFFASDVGQ